MLLAALAGEHLLLLGPPGTPKSELSRRLAALTTGRYFERLLTRFSVPEELFGPLSMRGLENDEYLRQVEGYLPTAEVAFIDEIFKANSAILNALLTLLNERLFDNGTTRNAVPLLTLVGASNELPESEELSALYDRFLLRVAVAPLSDDGVDELLRLDDVDDGAAKAQPPSPADAGQEDPPLRLSPAVVAAARAAAQRVTLPAEVRDLLRDLRAWLRDEAEPPVAVSDRRLRKAASLLRVAAATCGRPAVCVTDALLLEHVLWERGAEQAALVRQRVIQAAAHRLRLAPGAMTALLDGLERRARRADRTARECAGLVREAAQLQCALLGELAETDLSPLRTHVWLARDDAERAAQSIAALACVPTRLRLDAPSMLMWRFRRYAGGSPQQRRAELTVLLRRAVLLEEALRAAPQQQPQELATLLQALQLNSSDLRMTRQRLINTSGGSSKFYETCLFQVGDAPPILLCARFGRIGTDGRAVTKNVFDNMSDAHYHLRNLSLRKEREGYEKQVSNGGWDEYRGVSPQDDPAVEQCLALYMQHRRESASLAL